MPSIALFIKELLSEDKYDGTFTSKIEERISVLNAAQLQGLYNHLAATAKSSKTELWRSANVEIVDKIRSTLDERMKQMAAEQKVLEEYRLQQKQKRVAKVEAEREKQRVQEMIFQKAHDQASKEVKDLEMAREAKEKLSIMQRVFQAEEKRNKCLMYTALFFVLGIGAVVVGVYFLAKANILYIAGGVGFVLFASLVSVYFAVRLTRIKPTTVLPEDLEAQIHKREEELQEDAYRLLREKERKFEEQERRDKIERKKRKKQRKEQKMYEIELMEQQRQDRIRMAKEVVERQKRQKEQQLNEDERGDDALSVQSIASSLENHYPETVRQYSVASGWMSKTSSASSLESSQEEEEKEVFRATTAFEDADEEHNEEKKEGNNNNDDDVEAMNVHGWDDEPAEIDEEERRKTVIKPSPRSNNSEKKYMVGI